jgi:RNA polymerase sigma-70 factor (ECF subfamily)
MPDVRISLPVVTITLPVASDPRLGAAARVPEPVIPGSVEDLLAHREIAYLLALRMLGNANDAEDALQQAYLQALAFTGRRPVGSSDAKRWFLTVVANSARRLRNRQRRRRERELGEIGAAPARPPEPAGSAVPHRLLEDAVAGLDAKFRTAIALRYQMGLSYDEAAEVLSMPVARVRLHVSRGIAKLRSTLKRDRLVAGDAEILASLGALALPTPGPAGQAAIAQIAAGHPPAALLAAQALGPGAASGGMGILASALVTLSLAASAVGIALSAPPVPLTALAPAPAPALAHITALEACLDSVVSCDYRQDSLLSVVGDLEIRAGLAHGVAIRHPLALSAIGPITLAGDHAVEQVLAVLVRQGGLTLERDRNQVLLWRAAPAAFIVRQAEALRSADAATRRAALAAIAETGDQRAPDLLLAGLADDDASVRDAALDGLDRYAGVIACRADAEPVVRALARAWSRAASAWQRRTIAEVLASLDGTAAEALRRRLRHEGDAEVQERLAVLGESERLAAAPGVVAAVHQLTSSDCRSALGLSATPPATAVAAASLQRAGELVLAELAPQSAWLHTGLPPGTSPQLLEQSAADRAAVALAWSVRWGAPQALASLEEGTRDAEPTVRARAALALGMARAPSAVPALARLLADPELVVRRQALWALGEMRGAVTDQAIKRLNGDPQLANAAMLALTRQHPRDVHLLSTVHLLGRDQQPLQTLRHTLVLGDAGLSDLVAASERLLPYQLSITTALDAEADAADPARLAATPAGRRLAELELRLLPLSPARRSALLMLAGAPAPAPIGMPGATLGDGPLPSAFTCIIEDRRRYRVRIAEGRGRVADAIVACGEPGGELDVAYLASAWRDADGSLRILGRRALLAGPAAAIWAADSLIIAGDRTVQLVDDEGRRLHGQLDAAADVHAPDGAAVPPETAPAAGPDQR